MPQACSVVVYLGPARSGKTRELVRHYQEVLCSPLAPREERGSRSGPTTLNRAFWLAPNARNAAAVRGALLSGGVEACLEPGVITFHGLAELILAESHKRWRPLRPLAERALLRGIVDKALEDKKLSYFADAACRGAFIELLADHIHELKRADIRPAAYAKIAASHGNSDQHRELALLYEAAEQKLATHNLADEDAALLLARDTLAGGVPPRLRGVELIVVDGFTDFTRVQHELLRLLAGHAKRLHFSLPADVSSESLAPRTDLFAKTASTLAQLKYHHPGLQIQEFAARPLPVPAMDHAVRHIFRNPAHIPAPSTAAIDSLPQIEIVAAASVQDEITQIARRIKKQLVAGAARPADIAVIFRALADVAPRVREVFDEFGIPYHVDAQLPIATSSIVKSLLGLLRLDDENWPFRRVVAVVTNNTFTAFDAAARQAADWLVRDLQIAEGRDTLLQRVEYFATLETPLNQLSEQSARRVTAARLALPMLRTLAETLDALPKDATHADWIIALEALANTLGLAPFTQPESLRTGRLSDQSIVLNDDHVAWHSIKTHLASLERLNTWLDDPTQTLNRSDVIRTLVDIASHESLPRTHDDVGRVRVMSAPAARTIDARHVYLGGMSEQAFPMPERAGRLATDADYRFLARASDQAFAAAAKNGPPAPTRAQDEMLLFYEVLSRAEESLTISYPALDDKAQEMPPSPYVQEIERIFGEKHLSILRSSKPQLSPVPLDSIPYSATDLRILAVSRAIQHEPDHRLLAGIFSSPTTRQLASVLDAGLRIVYDRAHGDSFGPSEGLLTSPAVARQLAQRFGEKHFWSPSQWETYAACPYKFYLQDVLQLTPLGDLVLETDYTRRGSRLHQVLAAFHQRWPELRGADEMTAEEEQLRFLDELHGVIDERVAAAADGGIDAAWLELDRRQIRKWAADHFAHHEKYGGACSERGAEMSPAHFEFRFGPSRPGDAENDPHSTRKAFELEINGETIRVIGQIDRIDVGTIGGKTVFSVIDYKSGKKPALREADIESGERLQLPIYVEAAQALVFGGNATPLVAGYWSMTGGFDAKGALAVKVEGDSRAHWKKVRGTVEARIGQFVQDIRQGVFPVASRDDKCTTYCEFNTVCRIAQVRSLGKTTTPTPALSPQPPTPSP